MRKLAFLILFCAAASHAQGVRIGPQQVFQQGTVAGNPNVIVLPTAPVTISFCNAPANAAPCTNKATTYTDATILTACPTNQQIVLDNTNTCVSTIDAQANWGVWVAAGQYAYTITLSTGVTLGPFFITAGGSGGDLPPGITSWSQVPPCPYSGGQNSWNYDPLNTQGQGTFQCNPNIGFTAVVENPSVANENIINPTTATDAVFTANLPASYAVSSIVINDSTGTPRFFLDKNFRLWADSFASLNVNATSYMGCETIPSGQAPVVNGISTLLYGCDSSTNLPFWLDTAGVVTEPIGAATPKVLTHTSFDTAGASNIFKIGGQAISSTTGAFSKVASAGTFSGTSTLVCTDAVTGTSITTSGCPGSASFSAVPKVVDYHVTEIEATGAGYAAIMGDAATQTVSGTGSCTAAAPSSTLGASEGCSTNATPNSNVIYSGSLNYRTGRNIDFSFKGAFTDGSAGVTNSRVMFCVTDQSSTTQLNSSLASGNMACFRYDTGASDTTWRAITQSVSTPTNSSTGVTPDNAEHKYEIIFADSVPNVTFYIDGVLVATSTTNLPAGSTNLRYVTGYQNLSTNNGVLNLEATYLRSDK